MTEMIRVTALVENTAFGRHTRGEHGLALWIEAGSERVLLDTGPAPEVLLHNAKLFGIDLTSTDAVVLSHGHYDHTGGLEEVLRLAGRIPLFLHPGALARRFSRQKDGEVREIGAPGPLDELFLQTNASSLSWTTSPMPVSNGLWVTGPVPRATEFEDTGGDFFLDEGCATPDPIVDDQSVFFDSVNGTVVLLGCCHAGIINTLRYIKSLTGGRPIHAVIGGTHLVAASRNRMDLTVEALREMNIGLIAPAHCTGARAQARIASEFPGSWDPCHAGTSVEFPVRPRLGSSRTTT